VGDGGKGDVQVGRGVGDEVLSRSGQRSTGGRRHARGAEAGKGGDDEDGALLPQRPRTTARRRRWRALPDHGQRSYQLGFTVELVWSRWAASGVEGGRHRAQLGWTIGGFELAGKQPFFDVRVDLRGRVLVATPMPAHRVTVSSGREWLARRRRARCWVTRTHPGLRPMISATCPESSPATTRRRMTSTCSDGSLATKALIAAWADRRSVVSWAGSSLAR
jgi:hypothetical protein